MLNYDKFVSKYGESSVQALIERLERYEGVAAATGLSLEERWNHLMQKELKTPQHNLAA